MSILYANARSIFLKRNHLLIHARKERPDIIMITESWLNMRDKHLTAEVAISGYNLFAKCRLKKAGGGVLLYIKNEITAIKVSKTDVEEYDSLYVEIKNNNKKYILGVVYRPPKQTEENDMRLYNEIKSVIKDKNAVICGDFNNPSVDWSTLTGDREGRRLIDLAEDAFLWQSVQTPTRGNNILDLVFTNDCDLIHTCDVGEPLSNSDHNMVRIKLNLQINTRENVLLVPNYKKANFPNIKRTLESINWGQLLEDTCVEEMYDKFTAKLSYILNNNIPHKPRRIDQNKPLWMTSFLSKMIGDKRKAYKRYKLTQTSTDRDSYVNLKRACEREIRKKKRDYEVRISNDAKTNPKLFFSYIRRKKATRENIGPLLNSDDILVSDNKEMAQVLNQTFSKVFTKENDRIPDPIKIFQGSDEEMLCIKEITADEVRKYLRKIDPNKSTGPDDISPRILKECSDQLEYPITLLFNKSLAQGRIPGAWKKANITPIFKKGDKKIALNYRPISLTSVVMKLFEKIIRDKLVTFLEANKLITENQHGFRRNRSCLTNLLEFFNDVYANWDVRVPYDIIYLDFQKAFDTVPHKRLIAKMKAHGIGEQLCAWINDWLSNRMQRVVLNGEASDWVEVTSGVPQGSVLGPTLFTIYINDLESDLMSKVAKFADDTKLGGTASCVEDCNKIQKDLNKLSNWSQKWQMSFNVEKCKVMHIGDTNPRFKYHIRSQDLSNVKQEKDLGVIISNNLKTSDQCTAASKKANKMLGFITRNIDHKSPEIMKKLYIAFVRPHLEYAVQFWSPNYIKDQNSLERVQRRATKHIPVLRNLTYEERLKQLDMFPHHKRRTRGDLIEVFKILKQFDKINPEKLFEMNNATVTRGNGLKLKGQRYNTIARKSYFSVRVVDHWNRLPASVVGSDTINGFKSRLDKHFRETGFY